MSFQQNPKALLRQADDLFKPISSNRKGGLYNWAKAAWNSTISGDSPEDAAVNAGELYEQAAVAFQSQMQGLESAHAYKCAGDAYVRAGNLSFFTAARSYLKAWDQYKKTTQQDEGFRCLGTAVQCYCAVGNWRTAAETEKKFAEFLEAENKEAGYENRQPPHELERLQEVYQRAIDLGENDTGLKNVTWQCRQKAAEYAALVGDFRKATDLIDRAIRQMSLEPKPTMNFPAYTSLAAVIHLASGDMIAFERAMNFYYQVDSDLRTNPRKAQMYQKFAHLLQEGKEKEFRNLIAESKDFCLIQEPVEKVLNMIASNIQKNVEEEDFS